MMNDPAEWYLDVEGRCTGPYTKEQIRGFLLDGEVFLHHKVTSDRNKGEWQSVQEFLYPTQSFSKEKTNIPLRPPTFNQADQEPEVPPYPRENPTHKLFEALQVVREKQTTASVVEEEKDEKHFDVKRMISFQRIWPVAAAVLILVLIILIFLTSEP